MLLKECFRSDEEEEEEEEELTLSWLFVKDSLRHSDLIVVLFWYLKVDFVSQHCKLNICPPEEGTPGTSRGINLKPDHFIYSVRCV